MPANKNQIRRIQTLLKMMRQGRYPNYPSFMREMRNQDEAGAFKLSEKTFSRDIADLRDEYRAPIRYDNSRKGFYLADPEWYNEELMIEPFEMKAALLGERMANSLFPEPMRGEISRAVSALLMKNESGMTPGVQLENFQVLCPEGVPQIKPEVFLNCYNAWEQQKNLKLIYRSSRDHVSEKFFEPHIFAWNAGCWYLKGKLHRDDEKRYDEPKIQVLALHRIEKAEISGNRFWPEPAILKKVKESGLFDFKVYPEIDVEFFQPFAKVIAESYADSIVSGDKDSVRLKLVNVPKYEAVQLILGARGHAKVHAPAELQEKLRRIANRILSFLP